MARSTFFQSVGGRRKSCVLDLAMPRMDGRQTYMQLRDIDPDVRVLLATGYALNREAQAILDLCGNNQRELAMPWISGILTTVSYLMPWLGRALRPALERKGARVKKELKAKARAAASETRPRE